MSVRSILERKLARMELKTQFNEALYPYLDNPAYSLADDAHARSYSEETKKMMTGHEQLMEASERYRSLFKAFKEASDRGVAKLKEIESQVPDAEKQRQPFRFMFLAMATVAITNARTVISAFRNLNRMFDMYEKISPLPEGPAQP